MTDLFAVPTIGPSYLHDGWLIVLFDCGHLQAMPRRIALLSLTETVRCERCCAAGGETMCTAVSWVKIRRR